MRADVCLIAEGSYPYVTGGVSSWVHQLMTELPDLSFAVCYLGAKPGMFGERKYELPPNVTAFSEVYVMDDGADADRRSRRLSKKGFRDLEALHSLIGKDNVCHGVKMLKQLMPHMLKNERVQSTLDAVIQDPRAWDMITEIYEERASDESFLDYFWNFKANHMALWRVVDSLADLPEADVYHTVSTGYAGLLATLAKLHRHRPMILTEHGIYVKERTLEVSQTDWIYEEKAEGGSFADDASYFKRMWIQMFYSLGRMTYETADVICTLFEGNRQIQLKYGAEAEKIRIIPNGIWPERFAQSVRRTKDRRPTVALIGRVVPIKEVKTFLKAMKLVVEQVPGARALVVGPEDEDPDYAAGCHQLVKILELEDAVTFTGRVDVKTIHPEMDVLVLTSISEGLPLVILEASAAGIPTVASDVGACRELLEGRTEEDKALGPSGIVTELLNPTETAEGIVRLLTNPREALVMGRVAVERTQRFYHQRDILTAYETLYQKLKAGEEVAWPVSASP